jgi:sortase (surface protein transpeptidase)
MRDPGSVASAASVTRWRAAAALLVVLAVVCLVIWSDRPAAPSSAAAGATAPPSAPRSAPVHAGRPVPAVAEHDVVRPVRLLIPALDLDTRLITLGLRQDKTVEVPSDPDRAGWFRRGPPPGSLGSSVILGHVDSTEGPAVFAGLSSLTPGSRVKVRMDDGSVATFAVHSVKTFANEAFPAREVYGNNGRRELNLVTCGGVYDDSRGGYQSNVVVNARRI